MAEYLNLNADNLAQEHVCCAIADKKHQAGVAAKKAWLADRIPEGHVFRRLDAKGKILIEYAPLETAWVPVEGDNYLYIYCLWVAGSFKAQGHGAALLEYCIADAKQRGKSGICSLSAAKKKPFVSESKFYIKYGFEVVDTLADYQLLALSFDGSKPRFTEAARQLALPDDILTIYHSPQCPYTANCLAEVANYCQEQHIAVNLVAVDSWEKAKQVPGVFNNWATFYQGKFESVHLLNEGYLKKLLAK